jgi:hypothetical protein
LIPLLKNLYPDNDHVCNHWALQTNPNASCYVRHSGAIPDLQYIADEIYAERITVNGTSSIKSSCACDFSQITNGERSYYLTCAPTEHGTQAEFFLAYAAELAGQEPVVPGLIVDLHTGKDYLTEDPPNGLTGLETVGEDIQLQYDAGEDNMRIQIRKGRIDGHEFYHVRVHNWPDMVALDPEIMSKINVEIEKLCKEQKIQKVTIHCNGGLGRAPTMMYCNSIERVAQEANAQGFGCCCDWENQKQPMVGEKVNLAYAMRNMLLLGHAIRSTCGQNDVQFKSYKTFSEKMAEKYAQPPVAQKPD